ncbi:MAG: TatD family hydrolase [Parcubacteria group bacterium]|nr:TatD family hydrolase [Parcubacteria group bacterium]
MLIDTHGHLNFNAFRNDLPEVLRRTLAAGIHVIMPGTQYTTSKRAVEIAEQHPEGFYAAVGLHPIHIGERRHVDELELQSEMTPAPLETARPGRAQFLSGFETKGEKFDYRAYKELAKNKKVAAIGEVGLDYYYEPKSKERRKALREKQIRVLQEQMTLAKECNLPVILHCRKAHEDLIALIENQKDPIRGVVHCYTGNAIQAKRFLEMGLYIGFNGLILKHVPALPSPEEVIASIPVERIVLETDSPYLAPLQTREKRNEPLNVHYVAEEIARIKNVSFEEVARITTQNAKALFGI